MKTCLTIVAMTFAMYFANGTNNGSAATDNPAIRESVAERTAISAGEVLHHASGNTHQSSCILCLTGLHALIVENRAGSARLVVLARIFPSPRPQVSASLSGSIRLRGPPLFI